MNPFLDVTGRRQDENKRTQLNRKPQRISPLSTDVSANDNSFSEVDPRPSSTTIESLSRVKVSLRIRPLLNHEKRNGFMDETSNLLTTMTNPAGVQLRNPRNPLEQIHFNFDSCYGESCSQISIFKNDIEPVLPFFLKGYNMTLFAYGNTGAGKTYTMEGSKENPGMIPLCATSLFKKISPKKDILFLSFLEIYNEKVYDLLVPASSNFANAIIPDLAIREDAHKNILIPQMTKISIQNEEEFEKWWNIGCKNRTTAATKLNAQSSRSHSILILQLDPSAFLDCPERTKLTAAPSKLHLIDLAGSEDNRKTDNKGVRMMESTSINTSLFVLGKVVDALNQQNKDGKGNLAVRIPYRDSKLTRLLQDSLGGKSIALMIANVSPLPDHFHETFNTLTFASKSKHISNFVQMALKAVVPSPQIVENAKIQDWKFCQKRPLSELPNTGLLEASPYTNKKSKMTTNNPLRDNIFCLTEQDQLVKNEKLLSDKVEQLLMHKLQNGNGFLTPYLEKKFCQSTSLYQDHLKKSLFKANGSQASVSQLEISLEEDDMAYMKAFMTPNTRGKTARAIVQRALQLETEAGLKSPQNSLEWLEVLQNYRLAAKLLPTNEKLQKKITLLEDTLKNFEKLNKYSSPCNDGNSALESTPIVMKAASKKKKFSLDETGCSTRLSNGSTTIEPYIYPESLRPIKELSSGDLCLYTEKCLQSILNFGTKKQIMSLPGIGVKRYVKLETERNSNGYFYNIDHLIDRLGWTKAFIQSLSQVITR